MSDTATSPHALDRGPDPAPTAPAAQPNGAETGADDAGRDSTEGSGGPAASVDRWQDDESATALFSGDAGTLSGEQRRALVALLKNKFITSASHPAEWATIRDGQDLFRSRLHDMFLELHLDERYEAAFKRRVTADGSKDFPTLLQDLAWTREETLVLVFLRNRHRAEQMSGHDDVTVEREEIDAYVKRFRPAHATDRAADEVRFRKAVENLLTAKVLLKTNDADRYRISPVIPVLLPLARLGDLHDWLAERNASTAGEARGATTSGPAENADAGQDAPGLEDDEDPADSRDRQGVTA